jgi:hypothetical protein
MTGQPLELGRDQLGEPPVRLEARIAEAEARRGGGDRAVGVQEERAVDGDPVRDVAGDDDGCEPAVEREEAGERVGDQRNELLLARRARRRLEAGLARRDMTLLDEQVEDGGAPNRSGRSRVV